MKNTLALLLLLTASAAAAQTYQVNGYELPPTMALQTTYINDALPNVTGITVPLPWALIDNCPQTPPNPCKPPTLPYQWTTFDMSLAPYVASTCVGGNPCKINFEVNAATGATSNSSTPPYVFTSSWAFECCTTMTQMDVCFCPTYPGSMGTMTPCLHNGTDTTGVPASWQPQFYNAYYTFIKEVILHYSSVSWSSQVGYIRFGIGAGGGGVIPCPTEETTDTFSTPLSLSSWGNYANLIFSYAKTQNPPMIIEGSGYGGESGTITTAYAHAVASAAISNGAGYGAESLALHDLTLYSEGFPCSNDWCGSFNTYFIQSPPMLGLQPVSQSDPSCTTDGGAGAACSLVYTLPFATERHANAFELAYEDLLCAYDTDTMPEYITSYCPMSYAPYMPYQTAIANALAGQPNGTSTIKGKASVTGKAAVN